MTPTESQINAVALLAATAYWQGRLAQRREVEGSMPVYSDDAQRAGKADAWQWREKAKKAMEEKP